MEIVSHTGMLTGERRVVECRANSEPLFNSEFTKCYSQISFYLIFTSYDTDMSINLLLQIKKQIQFRTCQTTVTQPVSDKAEIQAHVFWLTYLLFFLGY